MPTATANGPASAKAATQINVRIDTQLKRDGDAALHRAGITPTQAVRAIWTLAAKHADDPDGLRDALLPEEAQDDGPAREAEKARKLRVAHEGRHIVEDACREAGIPWPAPALSSSYGELRERAFAEKHPDLLGGLA